MGFAVPQTRHGLQSTVARRQVGRPVNDLPSNSTSSVSSLLHTYHLRNAQGYYRLSGTGILRVHCRLPRAKPLDRS